MQIIQKSLIFVIQAPSRTDITRPPEQISFNSPGNQNNNPWRGTGCTLEGSCTRAIIINCLWNGAGKKSTLTHQNTHWIIFIFTVLFLQQNNGIIETFCDSRSLAKFQALCRWCNGRMHCNHSFISVWHCENKTRCTSSSSAGLQGVDISLFVGIFYFINLNNCLIQQQNRKSSVLNENVIITISKSFVHFLIPRFQFEINVPS